MAIKESELTTYSVIGTSDYVRSVTSSGASRKTLVSDLAKTLVEQYISSELAGSNRSIKSAIDDTEIDAEVIETYEALGWTNS
jgi:hypothetical protein